MQAEPTHLNVDDQQPPPFPHYIQSTLDLESYLSNPSDISVFQISQDDSWSPLLITEELFRKLCTALRVHPDFLQIVHTFGEKTAATEESLAASFTRLYPPTFSCDYEIAYNFKYVARHGRGAVLKDPFSIRQIGVYHRSAGKSGKSAWILLHVPEALSERLSIAIGECDGSKPLDQFRLHALMLSHLSEDWRAYIGYLEDSFTDLMDRSFSSSGNQEPAEGGITVEFADIRSLQILTDRLKCLYHLLRLNISLKERLDAFFVCVKASLAPDDASMQYETMMQNYGQQTQINISRIELLIDRAKGVSLLTEHILNVRNANTNYKMNLAIHDLSKQGVEENIIMRQLAAHTTKDTKTMRAFGLVAVVFLPATFLASRHFLDPIFSDSKARNMVTV
ncbi:hypothetical protein BLS_005224 [Venturia inaequalis]|uniref:CorA-like transporter domain-containing protein n=1 Tax=Venturia inaequalis TaxID=5025 RepID=A0A8H3YQI1_VENIN|nr:hypothetical protein BLS_005224 [Venturia inaequalis]